MEFLKTDMLDTLYLYLAFLWADVLTVVNTVNIGDMNRLGCLILLIFPPYV